MGSLINMKDIAKEKKCVCLFVCSFRILAVPDILFKRNPSLTSGIRHVTQSDVIRCNIGIIRI